MKQKTSPQHFFNKVINQTINKNGRSSFSCPSLDVASFLISFIKKRVVFVLDKKNSFASLSFFDHQKETNAFFIYEEKVPEISGFISFSKQLFNISSSRCQSDFENIKLCVVEKSFLNKKIFKETFSKKTLLLKRGDKTRLERVVSFLLDNEYKKSEKIEKPGDFVVRGGVVDLFPFNSFLCLRVSFLRGGLDIFKFNKNSLYSYEKIGFFSIGVKSVYKKNSVQDVFKDRAVFVYFKNKKLICINSLKNNNIDVVFNYRFLDKKFFLKKPKQACFFSKNITERAFCLNDLFLVAPFYFKNKKFKTKSLIEPEEMFVGDYYIHEDFGVCVYKGVDNSLGGGDYVCLKFADGFIKLNIEMLYKLYFYSEHKNKKKLNHLGRKGLWKNKKNTYYNMASLFVDSLVKAYKKRFLVVKKPCEKDLSLARMFASFFPHFLTTDQKSALKDVYNDMCSTKPMTRLLCGDVGFGKTEVALRAAFLAVLNNKSVVVLAPTSILKDQLFSVFGSRFGFFSVPVFSASKGFLNYPSSSKILISTHRVLSKKTVLSSCGLFIVDEEHRFGVKQKEKILKHNIGCDILYLSATPLPRSLQLSLSKVRAFSLIKTPPLSKKQTITNIYYFNKHLVVSVVLNELNRRGQVYVVDSSVDNVLVLHSFLSLSFPNSSVGVLYSGLGKTTIKKTMSSFRNKKINVLVSTSIIESGIDIGSANTIIVNNSHCFGLSQLYQLRGRVGRSSLQAYAYFLIPNKKFKTKNYASRLRSIQKNQKLGSGYSVAVDDLNIRGAGSLFGYKQSGGGGVGFEFYTKILSDVFVGDFSTSGKKEVFLNLGLAQIPPSFCFSKEERLLVYKTLSSCSCVQTLNSHLENLKSSFGSLPASFLRLFKNRELLILSKQTCLSSVVLIKNKLTIVLDKKSSFYRDFLLSRISLFFKKNKIQYVFLKEKKSIKIEFKKTHKDVYILLKLFVEVLIVK